MFLVVAMGFCEANLLTVTFLRSPYFSYSLPYFRSGSGGAHDGPCLLQIGWNARHRPKQAWYKAWCKEPGVASRQVARRVTMRGTTSINIKAILLLYM